MSFENNVHYRLRTIYIGGEITDETAREVIQGLLVLEKQSRKPVVIAICSPGGGSGESFAIYEAIRLAPFPTIGLVYGHALSSGFTILQACDKRLLSPNAVIMLHDGSAAIVRNHMRELDTHAKAVAYEVKQYHEVIAERTKLSKSQIKRWCAFGKYFTAKEAVKAGLADGILLRVSASRRKGS